MTARNLSPQEMFLRMAQAHRPRHAFDPSRHHDLSLWKAVALPDVLACLGEFPEAVPANPELLVEWTDNGLRCQKWIIDVAPFISATLLVNYPEQPSAVTLPTIQCCHGHGPYGKDVVMGDDSEPERAGSIARHNYNYGEQMAREGFVTYAIDTIGMGERNDTNKPNHRNPNIGGRDWCNMYYLHATMLGMTSISINVAHCKAATSFVQTLPEVDADQIGVMGLSGGGTMALWITLCDERIRATEIICYSDLFAAFGIRDLNYCGMQVAPGLYRNVDLPDLQGLIAPRPLLVDIGSQDQCFKVDSAMACFRKLETIYQAAGASAFHYINGEGDPQAECKRVGGIIRKHPIDVCFAGIDENGHLAFNDPPADFKANAPYLVVELDENCRRQQMGEGWFKSLAQVPKQAISMSIRQIMQSKAVICTVPDERKAQAVKDCLAGEVTPLHPSSILQHHSAACCFLDKQSASLL